MRRDNQDLRGTAQSRERSHNANPHRAHRFGGIPKQSARPRLSVPSLPVRLSQRDSTTYYRALRPLYCSQKQARGPSHGRGRPEVSVEQRGGRSTSGQVVYSAEYPPAVPACGGANLRGGAARLPRGSHPTHQPRPTPPPLGVGIKVMLLRYCWRQGDCCRGRTEAAWVFQPAHGLMRLRSVDPFGAGHLRPE